MSKIMYMDKEYGDGGSSIGTPVPTAGLNAQFDSTAHMNSTDMTINEISDFVEELNLGSNNYLCELIYDGSFTSGSATLLSSINNYLKLYIMFVDNDGCVYTDTIFTNGATTLQTILSFVRITTAEYRKSMIVAFDGTTMTSSGSYQVSGTATPTSGTYITIKKIYGIKPYDTDIILNQADFIVDQGISGIWTYRKWNSGIAECWGRGTATLTHYTTVGGFYGYYTDFALPSGLFTSITAHNYISTVGSGFAMPAAGQNSSTTNFRVYALATASGSQSCTFDMIAKGRWK